MAKPLVLIVHGMGTHSAASVLEEFRRGIDLALALYDDFTLADFDSAVDLQPVVYSDLIDDARHRIDRNAQSLSDALSGIGGDLNLISGAAETVNDVDRELGGDDFFNTHWLDVLLYRFTLLSEPIQLTVAKAIADALDTQGRSPKDVHIVAHSLGTAVTHDALAKIYGAHRFAEPGVPSLNPRSSGLGSVHQVANVSRLLETFVQVNASLVRPGGRGCVGEFREYRHQLDPFTVPRPFDPGNNGEWVSGSDFEFRYELLTASEVTQANTHALAHYLHNPKFHVPLLRTFWREFRPGVTMVREAKARHFDATLVGQARALGELIDDLDFRSGVTIREVVAGAKRFKDLLTGFGEGFA